MSWRVLMMTVVLGACAPKDAPVDDTDTDETDTLEETGDSGESDTDTETTDTDTDETGFVPPPDTADSDTDTDTEPPPCRVGWERDCGGVCFSSTLVGNNFCDDGPAPQADFNCEAFALDGGDCEVDTDPQGPCSFPGEVPDCNGACFSSGLLVGDGTCDDGTVTPADFDCESFSFDGGDCAIDTAPAPDTDTDYDDTPCPSVLEARDCNGVCWDAGWLGDGACDDGQVRPWGNPDFNCPPLGSDAGDCLVDTDGGPS